jgi:hypothetical protein
MSLGFDVSDTMRNIRIILEKHTKNMDWNESLPDDTKKDRTFRRITDPDLIIAADKDIREPGAQIYLVAEKHNISRTTVSNLKNRKSQFLGMPYDEKGIRKYLAQREKKYRERGKV